MNCECRTFLNTTIATGKGYQVLKAKICIECGKVYLLPESIKKLNIEE